MFLHRMSIITSNKVEQYRISAKLPRELAKRLQRVKALTKRSTSSLLFESLEGHLPKIEQKFSKVA